MKKITEFLNKYDSNHSVFLRFALAIILIMHSIPGMLDGSVNGFGSGYLNAVGFAPVGVPLAWLIKLSHVAAAALLMVNAKVTLAALITLPTMIMGIILVHFSEGWFVVGGGRNGMEYNFLIIFVFVQLIASDLRSKSN